jgi:hypothetical protein
MDHVYINDLPFLKMVIFQFAMLNYQRVDGLIVFQDVSGEFGRLDLALRRLGCCWL